MTDPHKHDPHNTDNTTHKAKQGGFWSLTHTKAMRPSYWRSRLLVAALMLLLTFIGLIITYIESANSIVSWYYWLAMGPIFAIIAIAYSFYLRKKKVDRITEVWHEVLHWVGMLIALFLIHVYVHTGIVGRFEGGLIIIALLSFSVFISGVYLESTFMIVGIILAVFALILSLVAKYLGMAIIALGLLMLGSGLFFLLSQRASREEANIESITQEDEPPK